MQGSVRQNLWYLKRKKSNKTKKINFGKTKNQKLKKVKHGLIKKPNSLDILLGDPLGKNTTIGFLIIEKRAKSF